MRGPERHSKTGKNSAFQAQCNHSHICCLLGQYSGCYRCGKFLTLLLKFIAFFGGLQWVGQKKKKWSWNAPRESPRTVKRLRGSVASWLNLPSTCCHVLEGRLSRRNTRSRWCRSKHSLWICSSWLNGGVIVRCTAWSWTYTPDIYDRNTDLSAYLKIRFIHDTVTGFTHTARCKKTPTTTSWKN